MTRSLAELQHEEHKLSEQLSAINDALAAEEYTGDYLFEFKEKLSGNDFVHGGLREMVEACNQKQLDFYPDFIFQAVETELFERFKTTVQEKIKGQATKYLMELKNELERKTLKDQKESREKKMEEVKAELASFDKMVKDYVPPVGKIIPNDTIAVDPMAGKTLKKK